MKRIALICILALAACTTAQQQNITALAANAQTQLKNGCALIQPTLLDLSASLPGNTALATLTADNGKLCAAASGLDATSVQTLINTTIPEAISLVSLLPIDEGTQTTIRIALGAASLALSNWLSVYGAPTA